MLNLNIYTRENLLEATKKRVGETKLGQTLAVLPQQNLDLLAAEPAKWVLIGVPEDIGVRANMGRPGATEAWEPALVALCNAQSNSFFQGKDLLVLGHVDCTELLEDSKEINEHAEGGAKGLGDLVEELDKFLSDLIERIIKLGKTPIVVGGGHNNAYPLLKGASKGYGLETGVNCFNCDPHADFRELEGRHSGNGFSYASAKAYLRRYFLMGYHESYNNQHSLDALEKLGETFTSISFDSLRIRKETSIDYQVERAVIFLKHHPTGIEIDLDSIEGMASSAMGPSGFSANQIRSMVYKLGYSADCAYLHIAEGAPELGPYPDSMLGKFIAYLVTDFVKAQMKKLKDLEE